MKRTFATFVQGLDHKERKTVPRGRPEDAQRWNDKACASTHALHSERQTPYNEPSTRCEEHVDSSAALGRIGRCVALANEGVEPGLDASVDDGLVGLSRSASPATHSNDWARRRSLAGDEDIARAHGGGEGESGGDEEDDDDCAYGCEGTGEEDELAMRCRWPGAEWTEEMRSEAQRQMEEAAMMPLPDGDEKEEEGGEAGGGKDGVKWVFKRVGEGI